MIQLCKARGGKNCKDKGMSFEEVAEITTNNAKRLFGIK